MPQQDHDLRFLAMWLHTAASDSGHLKMVRNLIHDAWTATVEMYGLPGEDEPAEAEREIPAIISEFAAEWDETDNAQRQAASEISAPNNANTRGKNPRFKHYRKKLPAILRKLGGVATFNQIAEAMKSLEPDSSVASIRMYCNACSVNGSQRHNLFPRDFSPENHFLIRLDKDLYAMFKSKYFDAVGIYRRNARPK